MNKQEIKSSATKEKLCNSYLELLKIKDINQITIKKITDNAGYNRGTFYIYYRDVYDMHNKIINKFITNTQNKVKMIIKDENEINFETIFKVILDIFKKNEKYLVSLIAKDNTLSNDIKKSIKPLLKQIFKKEMNNTKADYLIEYHLASIFGVINLWIKNKKSISIKDLFNLLKQITTKGVFNVMKEL